MVKRALDERMRLQLAIGTVLGPLEAVIPLAQDGSAAARALEAATSLVQMAQHLAVFSEHESAFVIGLEVRTMRRRIDAAHKAIFLSADSKFRRDVQMLMDELDAFIDTGEPDEAFGEYYGALLPAWRLKKRGAKPSDPKRRAAPWTRAFQTHIETEMGVRIGKRWLEKADADRRGKKG